MNYSGYLNKEPSEKQKKWDKYYYELCKTVSQNSSCMSRKIGSIIVLDKSIISTGYNGPPRGVDHCSKRWEKDEFLRNEFAKEWRNAMCPDEKTAMKDLEIMIDDPKSSLYKQCPRRVIGYPSGIGLHICIAGHAERNALINAARHGIAVKGGTLYLDTVIPCSPCVIEIINAGIEEVVCSKLVAYDGQVEYLIKNSGLRIREYYCETD